METDCGNGRLLAWLAKNGEVLSKRFGDEKMIIHCRMPPAMLGRIDPDEATVREYGGGENQVGRLIFCFNIIADNRNDITCCSLK